MATVTKHKPDDVAKAVAGIERAAGRLIKLLESDDIATQTRVVEALHGLGPVAVAFLGRALDRKRSSPRLRRRIIMALAGLAHHSEWVWPAFAALTMSLNTEEDPSIVEMTVAAVVALGPIPAERLPESLRRTATSDVTPSVAEAV